MGRKEDFAGEGYSPATNTTLPDIRKGTNYFIPEKNIPAERERNRYAQAAFAQDKFKGMMAAQGQRGAAYAAAEAASQPPAPAPLPNPHAELIQYFVNMGMNPTTATELAMKVGTLEAPAPPLANGVKLDPTKEGENMDHPMLDMMRSAASGDPVVAAKMYEAYKMAHDDADDLSLGNIAGATEGIAKDVYNDMRGGPPPRPDRTVKMHSYNTVKMRAYPPSVSAPTAPTPGQSPTVTPVSYSPGGGRKAQDDTPDSPISLLGGYNPRILGR